MPSLRDLHCFIEISGPHKKLQEFGTIYGDGSVETFVAVPNDPQPFAVRLTSSSFVAPGLAMFVFIDGVYQCNRNRQNLKLRKPPDKRALVDFCVRQKEEKQNDGSMIARDWRFEKLNISSAKEAPATCSPNVLENIGCIEVVVLRCAGPRNAKSASARWKDDIKSKAMNLDGAGDVLDHPFGLDGQPHEWGGHYAGPHYDDRGWQHLRRAEHPFSAHGIHSQHSASHSRPSPPPSPRSYYARTINSHDGTIPGSRHTARSGKISSPPSSERHYSREVWRETERVTPGVEGLSGILPYSYQYGSGPIAHQTKAESVPAPPPGFIAPNAPTVDHQWLDQLLEKAVKRGIEESQRNDAPQTHVQQDVLPPNSPRQPPGAWPLSPFGHMESTAQQPQPSIVSAEPPSVNFSTVFAPQGTTWGQQSAPRKTANRWSSPAGSNPDAWDTDETWGTKQDEHVWTSSNDRPSRSGATNPWDHSKSRPTSPTNRSTRTGVWHGSSQNWNEKSRPQEPVWESKEDKDGWTHIDAVSEVESSWSTVHPSSSVSAFVPSVPPAAPPTFKSYKTCSQPRSVTTAPPPNWGGIAPREARRHIDSIAFSASTPYGITFEDFMRATTVNDDGGAHREKDDSIGKQASWGKDNKNTWGAGNDDKPRSVSWGKDNSNDRRSRTAKTIATLDDGWGDNAGWGNAASKSTQDNAWSSKDNKSQSGGWYTIDNAKNTEDQGIGRTAEEDSRGKKDGSKEKGAPVPEWQAIINGWGASNDRKDDGNIWTTEGFGELKKKLSPGNGRTTSDEPNTWDALNSSNPWATPTPLPAPPTSKSKPITSKSRLTNYHQHRSASADSTPKKHWQFPLPPSDNKIYPILEKWGEDVREEPPYIISKEKAGEKGAEHQVRAGKGMKYGHAVGRPEYIDSLDKPYAVFRFKYRSRDFLKKLFGDQVPDVPLVTLVPLTPTKPTKLTKPTSSEQVKEKLKELPQDALIEGLLKLQTKLTKEEKKKPARSPKTEDVGRDRTKDWVRQHSREASEKGKGEKGGWDTAGWG